MAVVKNLNTSYVISNKSTYLANVDIETHTVFVNGNLVVGGNTTQITKTELSISDNTITVNKGEAGAGVTLLTAGLEVDRGSSPNVSVLWNETYGKWTITNDGSAFGNIATSSGAGATAVIDDPAPQLGGNLDVLARTIFSSNTQQVKLDSNIAIKIESVNIPTAIAGYNTIYASTPGEGNTGLYQTSLTTSNELISKSKAVWYSLIL